MLSSYLFVFNFCPSTVCIDNSLTLASAPEARLLINHSINQFFVLRFDVKRFAMLRVLRIFTIEPWLTDDIPTISDTCKSKQPLK